MNCPMCNRGAARRDVRCKNCGTPLSPNGGMKAPDADLHLFERAPSSMFRTYTGKLVDVLAPKATDIDLVDIVEGLARTTRYNGGVHTEYCSVAEHSVLVSRLCRPNNAGIGLLHDASEAYVGDVISPLKRQLPAYKRIENLWMLVIGQAMGIGDTLRSLPTDVHVADMVALQTERRDCFNPSRMDPDGPEPWPRRLKNLAPHDAAGEFYKRFREIFGVAP